MIHWEAHACLPLHPAADFSPLTRYLAAGVHFVSINVGMCMNPVSQILPVLAAFRANIAAAPHLFLLARTVADVQLAFDTGRLAVAFDLEGALPLLDEPAMAGLYSDLGVRQIHLAYNRNNAVADGCHDVERGLTPLGVRMVAADASGATSGTESAQRPASELEKVLRAEARKLALKHHNNALADAHDGPTNLASNAAQQLVEARLVRYGRRQQTLLSGLLNEWKPEKASLYTFISRVASSFLMDVHRQVFGDARKEKGNRADGGDKAVAAPTQAKARRKRPKADQQGEATPPEWVRAGADAGEDEGRPTGASLDAIRDIDHTGPAEEILEVEELHRVLDEAVRGLSEEMQLLFKYEMAKHEDGLSDEDIARRLGCNRATWRKRQDAMHRALR